MKRLAELLAIGLTSPCVSRASDLKSRFSMLVVVSSFWAVG